MSQCAHSSDASRFLSTSKSGSRDEEAGVFAPEATLLPLAAGGIEENLELSGKVPVASRNTEKYAIIFLEFGWGDGGDGGVFGRRVH